MFVKSFSEALRVEYSQYGITVQHLLPLFVNTKMNAFSHRLQETSLFVPDAERYARNAVNTLGQVESTTGYWAHGLQVLAELEEKLGPRTLGAMTETCHRLGHQVQIHATAQAEFLLGWFLTFDCDVSFQYFFTVIPPVWVRTQIGAFMNQTFRKDYLTAHLVSNNNLKVKEIPPTVVTPPPMPSAQPVAIAPAPASA